MVRRVILLFLAGIFWLAGVGGMYQHIEASSVVHAKSQQKTEETMSYQFPFAIPGTDLVALELRSYSGIYLEEGSQEGVSNVAAIVLCNDGPNLLEHAQVELWKGKEKLNFELSYLPAGEKILVLESNKHPFTNDLISACSGNETLASREIPDLIRIQQIGDRIVSIANPGPLPLKKLKVYYKNYDFESAMFLGGIVYEISIFSLAPGESFVAQPMYYSSETSRIVNIKTSG